MAKRSRPTVGGQLDEIVGGGSLEQLVNAPKVTQSVPLTQLAPMGGQPRRAFNDATLADLARSIREQGVLQPLLVRPRGTHGFEIVAGERRYRAAQLAGLAEVPVVVREVDDEDARTLALVENLQREDLNPVDRADAIARLVAQALGIPADRVGAQLSALRKHPEGEGHPERIQQVEAVFEVVGGSWRSFLTHLLPVLRFPDDVLSALRAGQLEYTKGAVIARVGDPGERLRLLELARSGASLEELRAAVRQPARQEAATSHQRLIKALNSPARMKRLTAEKQARVRTLLQELDALLNDAGKRK